MRYAAKTCTDGLQWPMKNMGIGRVTNMASTVLAGGL